MQTYYQKHRTIQAFQFDGTWRQLDKEIPNITHRLIYELGQNSSTSLLNNEDITAVYYQLFNDHHIANLACNNEWWPCHNYKIKKPKKYWKSYLNLNNSKQVGRYDAATGSRITYHYKLLANDIQYGSYVSVNHSYKNIITEKIQIRIRSRKSFESHWSPVPIKPKKHRSR